MMMTSKPFKDENNMNKRMDRRTFLTQSSKVTGTVVGLTLLGSFGAIPVSAVSKSPVKHSKGRKADLVFPVINDVHIKYNDEANMNKFTTTLNQLNQVVPQQDALVAIGDLTEYGYETEYDIFMEVYEKNKNPDATPMFAIGNHDYWNGLSPIDSQKRFCQKTGMKSHYYHQIIKGYHFIILGTEDGKTEGTFSTNQIKWLENKLLIASNDDWKKPIFVFHHQPIKETVYGSEWGFSENRDLFYNTLKKFPQVITFSGHTHYPLDDPKIIHQKDFTTIGTSTGAYAWLEGGRIQGAVPDGANMINQALIVEVYNNKLIIKRRDIHNNDWSGEDFEINYPINKRNFKYTENRDKKPPYFTKDAMVSILNEATTASSLTILLTQAEDDLLVHDYKLKLKNIQTGKIEKEYLDFSEFYKDPMPNPLRLSIDRLQANTTYDIEIHALDAFGNKSKKALKLIGRTQNN
ncbi:phosphatase [Virgibacillus dokdonensis]|uniref:Phosphatase n=2 Tax=Virgibacillus dokdonensis TaxID=302167 RepID=A0A3E0WQ85_9BACI|nr:phosphatase [Virgibacillus dokdonensis]